MSDRAQLASALDAWEQGPTAARRLRAGLEPRRLRAVQRGESALEGELRRRLGPAPTLDELGAAYRGAEAWARDVVADALAPHAVPEALAPLVDCAFLRLARLAQARERAAGMQPDER